DDLSPAVRQRRTSALSAARSEAPACERRAPAPARPVPRRLGREARALARVDERRARARRGRPCRRMPPRPRPARLLSRAGRLRSRAPERPGIERARTALDGSREEGARDSRDAPSRRSETPIVRSELCEARAAYTRELISSRIEPVRSWPHYLCCERFDSR